MTDTIVLVTKPMSYSELKPHLDNDGCFCLNVLIDLDWIIESDGIDGFLDVLQEAMSDYSWLLTDIRYEVIGAKDGDVMINVKGFADFVTPENEDDEDLSDC